MRTLRQQMAVDAVQVLDTRELGEVGIWSDGTTTTTTRVRVIEQGERQTVRRASVLALHGDRRRACSDFIYPSSVDPYTPLEDVAPGNTFTVTRGGVSTVYRVLYSDHPETALQRHLCHHQLESLVTVVSRERFKTLRGADGFIQSPGDTQYRAKFTVSDAENMTSGGQRRMRTTWQMYMEDLPPLTTDQLIVDENGRAYRIESVERPLERIDLPYLLVSRSDS